MGRLCNDPQGHNAAAFGLFIWFFVNMVLIQLKLDCPARGIQGHQVDANPGWG
jgi:hypothetical protein